MILTTCAACAAPLALNAPRCVRCQVRYCNKTCQMDHWRRGHKQIRPRFWSRRPRARLGPDEYVVCADILAKTLNMLEDYAESIALLRDVIPSSIAAFGLDERRTLRLRYWLADALLHAGTDKAMIREAIEVFEDTSL
ncbi:unnamed protein product, partial [Pelagomonas calceolata]